MHNYCLIIRLNDKINKSVFIDVMFNGFENFDKKKSNIDLSISKKKNVLKWSKQTLRRT